MDLPLDVKIHGVNQVGHESGNATACQDKDLPWLQEVPEVLVWSAWNVAYRDVVILDGKNVPVQVFNLTDNNLGDPAKFAILKSLLTDLAGGDSQQPGWPE